jgi:hypothetical protein
MCFRKRNGRQHRPNRKGVETSGKTQENLIHLDPLPRSSKVLDMVKAFEAPESEVLCHSVLKEVQLKFPEPIMQSSPNVCRRQVERRLRTR